MKAVLQIATLVLSLSVAAQPFAVHPENPHYFLYDGKPTVLITSAEHYGSVINLDFDYEKYLDTLAADSLNHTRVFVGPYREAPGSFGIGNNVLAPRSESFICAWQRSETPDAYDKLNKFDLTKFNPEFFTRLKNFCQYAKSRNIIIEITLFCPYYDNKIWKHSPLYPQNNINGLSDIPYTDVYKMANTKIVNIHTEFTRKIVTELNAFDNIYYEICNEPWVYNAEMPWQHHIIDTIVETEKTLPKKHLISLNISNGYRVVTDPHPAVSIFNFHYASPPTAIAANFHLNLPIGLNETGFTGSNDATYRIQAWQFILAGGALYNNLDYSFAPGHEDGLFKYDRHTPGGGSADLRKQLKVLAEFINSFDLLKMKPANDVFKGIHTLNGTAFCLANKPDAYAIHTAGFGEMYLYLDLPHAEYKTEWIDTKTGKIKKTEQVNHTKNELLLTAPKFKDDIALRITKIKN